MIAQEGYDVVVIGAGPAGMAAACTVSNAGARVLVLDEQRAPGGQIYRAIETNTRTTAPDLGEAYYCGKEQVAAFRACDADYIPGAVVWQVSDEREIGYSVDGAAALVRARHVIIASGAQERPFPIPGWTKAGVMTAGAAQILLKQSRIGIKNAIFIGTGPLLFLLAYQYIEAGLPIRAFIDLTPRENYLKAIAYCADALGARKRLYDGWRWRRALAATDTPIVTGVEAVRIVGEGTAAGIDYKKRGAWESLTGTHVLLHQGIIPNINISLAAGCGAAWDRSSVCWTIRTDEWYRSIVPGISVVGDAAAIGGAVAAPSAGTIAGLEALCALKVITAAERDKTARPHRLVVARERRLQRFLSTLFRPAERFRVPLDDDTIVCRCEEVSVGAVRQAVLIGCDGPNQLKSFSRCGMGPCQGRFCGTTVSELIATINGSSVEDTGYFRLRPPIKPLRLEELAGLDSSATV